MCKRPPMLSATCVGMAALFVASCSQEESIRVFEVVVPEASPRDLMSEAAPPASAVAAAGSVVADQDRVSDGPSQGGRQIRWETPDGWQTRPLTQFINRGYYLLPGPPEARPELTISAYPGAAGGLDANLNRWRGQLGLEPLDSEALAAELETIEVSGMELVLCDFTGNAPDGSPSRTLGAVIEFPDETWFFKLTGNPDVLTVSHPTFGAFLRTLELEEGGESGTAAALPPAYGQGTPPPAQPAIGEAPSVSYQVPQGWSESPASGMRAASFQIDAGDNFEVDVSLVRLGGAGAGDAMNVNLWREQLGLATVSDEQATAALDLLEVGPFQARIFDQASDDPIIQGTRRARILAALFDHGGTTWVLRARGADEHVAAERERFLSFLESLELP